MKAAPAIVVDITAVVVFAIVGRRSHQEANDLLGVVHTAWPFLVGCLGGLVIARSWRSPLARRTGVVVWLSTVGVGMLLRVLSGNTAQVSFVVVATIVLGVLLVGWRAAYAVIIRARQRPRTGAAA